jgi:hypothetical protein
MALWYRLDVGHLHLEGLIRCGLLCARTAATEWLMPSREDAPAPLDGYIISFVPFHERGFMMPPHPFLRRLLHHYQI